MSKIDLSLIVPPLAYGKIIAILFIMLLKYI